MKIIPKYFNGGMIAESISPTYNPLPLSNSPMPAGVPAQQEEMQSKQAAKTKADSDKAAQDLVGKGAGIMSDVAVVMNRRNAAMNEYQNLDEFDKATGRGKQLLAILQGTELNDLTRYAKHFDEAKNLMVKRESEGDYAYTRSGIIAQLKDGSIRTIGFDKLNELKAGEDYYPMTVNEVMWARETNPNLSLHRGIDAIESIQYTAGTKQTVASIRDIAAKIKSDSKKDDSGISPDDPMIRMIGQLTGGELSGKTWTQIKTNYTPLVKAINSIYQNLTPQEQKQLQTKAYIEAAQKGVKLTDEALGDSIHSQIMSALQPFATYEASTETGGSSAGKGSSASPGGLANVKPQGYFQAVRGASDYQDYKMSSTEGRDVYSKGFGIVIDDFTQKRADLVDNGKFANFVNLNEARDANGNPVDKDSLIFKGGPSGAGNKPLYAYLPVNANGVVSPEMAAKYDKLLAVVEKKQSERVARGEKGMPTPDMIGKWAAEAGLQNITGGYTIKPFVVATGRWAGDTNWAGQLTGWQDAPKGIKILNSSEEKDYLARLSQGDKDEIGKAQVEKIQNWLNSNIYEGTVYIPVTDSGIATAAHLDGTDATIAKSDLSADKLGGSLNEYREDYSLKTSRPDQKPNLHPGFNFSDYETE